MLLALLFSVFRLLLDDLVDRRRSDASTRLELLVLRHQLRVLERQAKRPPWRSADRLTLAGLSRRLPHPTWFCFLVSPQTLLRWLGELVRRGWALFARRPRLGRPGLAAERSELILSLAREKTRWATAAFRANCSSSACAAPTRPFALSSAAIACRRRPFEPGPAGGSSSANMPTRSWPPTSSSFMSV